MSEITRYSFEAGYVTERPDGYFVTHKAHAAIVEQLEQELAEAKKDQARYLKLIETGNFCPTKYSGLWGLHMSGEPYTKAELDAPIDKAIAAIKESK